MHDMGAVRGEVLFLTETAPDSGGSCHFKLSVVFRCAQDGVQKIATPKLRQMRLKEGRKEKGVLRP